MYLLDNAARDYDWGSRSDIPQFLGRSPGDRIAEVWMGTHPLGPSSVLVGDTSVPLSQVAGELPFLFKILAADRPLSLQVHPNASMAQAGFEAEEAAGVPIDAPERTYRDPSHKPEMAYALTTFDTLVGFRPTAEILRVLNGIDTPLTQSLADGLRERPGFRGIVRLVERLLTSDVSTDEIGEVVEVCRGLVDVGVDVKRAYVTAVEIAEFYPGDIGVIISLTLNRLTLQPGEAAFLGAGIIHAHLKGMCLEIMAASDNVLRAGLTTKSLDPKGLVACLEKGMSRLARVTPEPFGFSTEVFHPDVEEFALAVGQSCPPSRRGCCSHREPSASSCAPVVRSSRQHRRRAREARPRRVGLRRGRGRSDPRHRDRRGRPGVHARSRRPGRRADRPGVPLARAPGTSSRLIPAAETGSVDPQPHIAQCG
ncbi:mannose-6-phosphate isomerase, class I [Aeromicrobium sp. UC242_57]|uniref:mannose-6-phosphate isomerase, class I n=1 Tax=Aeromicrobium sp. UC242_57 TaxID=3374624 RepID=UPI0037B9142C